MKRRGIPTKFAIRWRHVLAACGSNRPMQLWFDVLHMEHISMDADCGLVHSSMSEHVVAQFDRFDVCCCLGVRCDSGRMSGAGP